MKYRKNKLENNKLGCLYGLRKRRYNEDGSKIV